MGVVATISSAVRRVARPFIGERTALPDELVARYPQLARARYRRGGLPARVGGWCLGERTVAAITLWKTIWLAPETIVSDELLLHELRHVEQFEGTTAFPVRYVWETLRRGYSHNRFEVDARAYAEARLRKTSITNG